MRVGHLRMVRPDWYDRDVTNGGKMYAANNVGPHGATDRWTYTIPTGKSAYMDALLAYVERVTVPGSSGRAECYIVQTSPSAAQIGLGFARLFVASSQQKNEMFLGAMGMLAAGWTVTGSTSDASVGGAHDYAMWIKTSEFIAPGPF